MNYFLIHLRNCMKTVDDTARRIPGLSNVRISGQTVRRRLRESRLRARGSVAGPILRQRHRAAIAWARARRPWRLHTWQYILFSDEIRFSLRFIDGRYRVYRSCVIVLLTSVCIRVRPFWRRKCYGLNWNLS